MKYEMTLRENIAISDWKHLNDTDKIQELLKTDEFTGVFKQGSTRHFIGQ